MLEWFDWQSVFLVNVPVAAIALLLGIRYVPESRDPKPGSFDVLGAALSAAGVQCPRLRDHRGARPGLDIRRRDRIVRRRHRPPWRVRLVGSGTSKQPMLNLGFFRSARFSVGTAAVSVAFFALLGAIFALTQYLQFAHGYSAIEAGAIMSPIALGLMMGAGSSSKAVRRLGTSRVVAAGLSGLAVLMALTIFWSPSTNALMLAAWFFGLALAMGWVMAPATEAVIGAVPAAKTGVASATNTVARMVSGALGVAVVGSLVSSLYSADVEGSVDALPPRAQAAAESSVGAASAIAGQLPPNAASALLSTTGDAFTQAMGTGLLVAAATGRRHGRHRDPLPAGTGVRRSDQPRTATSPCPQQARAVRPTKGRRLDDSSSRWYSVRPTSRAGRALTLRLPTGRVPHRGSRRSSVSFVERWQRNGSPDSRSVSARTAGSPISAASARRTTPGDR